MAACCKLHAADANAPRSACSQHNKPSGRKMRTKLVLPSWCCKHFVLAPTKLLANCRQPRGFQPVSIPLLFVVHTQLSATQEGPEQKGVCEWRGGGGGAGRGQLTCSACPGMSDDLVLGAP